MNAKITIATARKLAPKPGSAVSKAAELSTAPFRPLCQAPVTISTRPVIVQTISVSMKVPIMPISPDSAAWRVRPAACAMPAVPRPASLEKMPRATP